MNIIFVSPDGSDLAGDGSYALPYKTIEKAVSVFSDGDQIRLMDGTYNPRDSIVLDGVTGSILAENPANVTIVPTQVTSSNAVINIKNSSRFFIGGINIYQATSWHRNTIGILGFRVDNFIVHTCAICDFEVPSAYTPTVGIMASGSGRIESCQVSDLASSSAELYGIWTDGFDIVDCEVHSLSGNSVRGIYASMQTLPQIVNYSLLLL